MKLHLRARSLLFATLATQILNIQARAEASWPGWRGVKRDDISPDKGLLAKWPEGGPKRAWLFENAGIGYAGPAIVDGKLFTLGAREDAEQLLCLDAKTGKELWATELSSVFSNNWGDGPRATPTVDGTNVYAMSAKGALICADTKAGKIQWKKDITKDLGGVVPGWGYTESVLVDGDLVICTPGGKKGAIAALNKKSGAVVWQAKGLENGAQYSSPIVAEIHGKRQYIQMMNGGYAAVDAKNGDVLWKGPWRGSVAVIPTPICKGNSVYFCSGYGAGCIRVTIAKDWSVKVDYDMEKDGLVNHHGGVILVGDHLYGHSDSGGWTCQEWESGKIVWRSGELGKGAVGFADGKLYCLEESSGKVVLAEASPSAWKELSAFTLDPQTKLRKPEGRIWTHPVIINGKLYLRDQNYIYCYDVK